MEITNRWLIGVVVATVFLVGGGAIFQLRNNPALSSHKITAVDDGTAPLKQPIIKITDPQRGDVNAPLTIVYFADFGCESCSATWPLIQSLESESQFKNKLRFVFKDFPAHQNVYPESLQLHKAARCAASMGKFWEFQAAAFSHYQDLIIGQPTLEKSITEAGLDSAKVHACMDSPGIQSAIDDDFNEGQRLGIESTPTFFVGNERIVGLLNYDILVGKIRTMLAQIERTPQQTQ